MFLSVFDIFKIGIGPSSSHTMGPMTAANRFLELVSSDAWPRPDGVRVTRLNVSLHGSLAHTGVGHRSGDAVMLGLMGETPDQVDPDRMEAIVKTVNRERRVTPPGHPPYDFDSAVDLVFDKKTPLPGHANGMRFTALDRDGRCLLTCVYYSVGGGFVVTETELARMKAEKGMPSARAVPYPFVNAGEMLAMAAQSGLTISEMQRVNDETFMTRAALDDRLDRIWAAMSACMDRGLRQDGELPGGLKVRRRARAMYETLQQESISNRFNPVLANDWLSLFAMAVNEENAAGGRVVTAPTNGAAGVVPAVIRYYRQFYPESGRHGVRDYLLTAAAIGGIIKRNASISGAESGCQGEVGSASAMAAAGLAAVMGGSPQQIENAAEIALEHHLGMTCDPVAGLVQVPCIERNALGAVKAVTAASLALKGDGRHFVSLDTCVETMRQTGADMSEKYKETSLGGLAVNAVECWLGNVIGGALPQSLGNRNALLSAVLVQMFGLAGVITGLGAVVVAVALVIWSIGAFATAPMVHGWAIETALGRNPRMAAALNVTAFNAGLSLSAMIAGSVVARDGLEALAPMAFLMVALVLPIALLLPKHTSAARQAHQKQS